MTLNKIRQEIERFEITNEFNKLKKLNEAAKEEALRKRMLKKHGHTGNTPLKESKLMERFKTKIESLENLKLPEITTYGGTKWNPDFLERLHQLEQ